MYQHVFNKNLQPIQSRPDIVYFADTSSRGHYPPRILHRHMDRCELILVTAGSGEFLVGSQSYPVHEGDFVIINAGEIHDERSHPDAELDTFCCGITGILRPGYERNQLIDAGTVPVIPTGRYYAFFKTALSYMNDAIMARGSLARDLCTSMVDAQIAVIREILDAHAEQFPIDSEYLMVDRIRTFLDDHYNEVTGLDEIASSMNVSISYLSHMFKRATGYSPKQYVILRRLGEAQTLLAISQTPVTEISAATGYDNSNYFSTLFTKTVGMTPSKYRTFCQEDMYSEEK